MAQGKLQRTLAEAGNRDYSNLADTQRIEHVRAKIRLQLRCPAKSQRRAQITGTGNRDDMPPGVYAVISDAEVW